MGLHSDGRLLALTANIESVTVVNLQAYVATKIITTVKGFMIQAPGVGYVYVTIQYLQKIEFSKSRCFIKKRKNAL